MREVMEEFEKSNKRKLLSRKERNCVKERGKEGKIAHTLSTIFTISTNYIICIISTIYPSIYLSLIYLSSISDLSNFL
tara:strand:+ start:56 stop:289 length:234 start_codon:yes stop_codon:yes gene_type:complete